MTDLELKKSLLSCPGDTIQEHIDFVKMSQAELAERLGRSIPKLNELIKGKAPITKETATKLEYVLNIPASFWINLERKYQDEVLEIDRMEDMEKCENWASSFPLKAMKSIGVIPNIRDKSILAESLLKFFRVASPEQWSEIYKGSSLAFKIELKHTAEPEAISVWLRLGEIQAEKLEIGDFNKSEIKKHFSEFKKILYKCEEDWLDQLQALCAKLGIALVYTPCIAKAPIYGATRWIKNNSFPLIQITDRRKDYHSFWFTFYHELAHILYHGKKDIFIDGLQSITPDTTKEREADNFAAKKLLSEKEKKELFQNLSFNTQLIFRYSEKFEIHPSIIVGQIQRKYNDLYKSRSLNRLKVKVKFNELKLDKAF
jgi:addiction module HigA family antidote